MNTEARAMARAFVFRVTEAEYGLRDARDELAGLRRFLRHDFRTPLSVLLGHAQLLAEGMGTASRSVRVMFEQTQKLSVLIDALAAPTEVSVPPLIWLVAPASAHEQLAALCIGRRMWVIAEGSTLPETGEALVNWPPGLGIERANDWLREQRLQFA